MQRDRRLKEYTQSADKEPYESIYHPERPKLRLKRPPGWNRKCQRCDCDPWPNYLHCHECKTIMVRSHSGGLDEKEVPHRIRRGYTVGANCG